MPRSPVCRREAAGRDGSRPQERPGLKHPGGGRGSSHATARHAQLTAEPSLAQRGPRPSLRPTRAGDCPCDASASAPFSSSPVAMPGSSRDGHRRSGTDVGRRCRWLQPLAGGRGHRWATAMLGRGRSEGERPPHRDDVNLQEKLGLLQAGPVRIARTDSPAVKRAGERARRMAGAARAAHNLDGLLDAHRAYAGLLIRRRRRGLAGDVDADLVRGNTRSSPVTFCGSPGRFATSTSWPVLVNAPAATNTLSIATATTRARQATRRPRSTRPGDE